LFLLVCCLAYSFTLKMEAVVSLKCQAVSKVYISYIPEDFSS
jgi:hypothetical protein